MVNSIHKQCLWRTPPRPNHQLTQPTPRFTMRGTPFGMDAWKTSAIFGALKCKTERGPIRSWRQISCRSHQDSRVCLLRFVCSVSGPRSGGGLFDRCTVCLFQSRWRAFVARSHTVSFGLEVPCSEKCFFVSSSVIRGAFTIFYSRSAGTHSDCQ